jgi:predicted phosphodiesterase
LNVKHNVLDDVDRIFCLSDLHVDHAGNREWLQEKCQESILSDRDLLVVAGDVSHSRDRLQETFATLQETGCRIIFCPGNHEAWLRDEDDNEASSYEKLQRVEQLCRDQGVLVDPTLITNCQHPLWIVPLQSWYDASLSIPECEDLCTDFDGWPWTDFRSCKWTNHPSDGMQGKIPTGLAKYFHEQNLDKIDYVKETAEHEAIMTMSHFLPNVQCLPDWKDVSSNTFNRNEWFDHGAPGTSAKFAKVAGSSGLEQQIRSLESDIHVFGHSHRPKDFELNGIRYVHNPLGNPRERKLYMVSPDVQFQLLWDTRTTGQVPGRQVIRLWEEQGGGIPALIQRWGQGGRRKRRLSSKSRRII